MMMIMMILIMGSMMMTMMLVMVPQVYPTHAPKLQKPLSESQHCDMAVDFTILQWHRVRAMLRPRLYPEPCILNRAIAARVSRCLGFTVGSFIFSGFEFRS